MTTEHDLPPLPEPIGLGLLRYPYDEDDMRSYALAAVEQFRRSMMNGEPAHPTIPDGYALVPVEPTEEMVRVGALQGWSVPAREVYVAMIQAHKEAGK